MPTNWRTVYLASLLALAQPILAAESLTLVSWGGSYGRAIDAAFLAPFTEQTGIEINVETFNGGLAEVRAQVETGSIHWDIVDLETKDMATGCDEGLFELVDVADMPAAADGTPAADDYLPGDVTECGCTMLYYSWIYAYNADMYDGAANSATPATIEDFFDLAKFPGRRGTRRVAQGNLEFALLADGVAPEQVYETLSSPAGLARAFAKLDAIKHSILWWEAGSQALQMLADQEVAMTAAFNGRIFHEVVMEDQPFAIVWDGQVLTRGGFAIVEGAPNAAAARRFLAYVAQPETQARVGRYISYSPTRLSGASLASTHLATGIEMAPHMPTDPRNMGRALRTDWQWWADYGDEVNERFSAWLAQ